MDLDNLQWDNLNWAAEEIGRAYKSVIYLEPFKRYYVESDNSVTLPDATDPTIINGTEIWLLKEENTNLVLKCFVKLFYKSYS